MKMPTREQTDMFPTKIGEQLQGFPKVPRKPAARTIDRRRRNGTSFPTRIPLRLTPRGTTATLRRHSTQRVLGTSPATDTAVTSTTRAMRPAHGRTGTVGGGGRTAIQASLSPAGIMASPLGRGTGGDGMPAKPARRPRGRTIDVERVVSVGHDRELNGVAIVRLRDEKGAMLALRLRPGQVRTLAHGLGGIVAAVE